MSIINGIEFEATQYGFKYGAAEIIRLFSSKKDGWVVIEVKTKRGDARIRITKTGIVKSISKRGKYRIV
jgi:hypothetical protein